MEIYVVVKVNVVSGQWSVHSVWDSAEKADSVVISWATSGFDPNYSHIEVIPKTLNEGK